MKKFLSVMLAICMIVSIVGAIPTVVMAEEYSGSCGDSVNWSLDTATGILTISGSGDMNDFARSAPWYNYKSSIKKAIIEEGVTSIGDYTFYNHPSTSITIPDSVTSIGEGAFAACRLTSITIPDSVESIGSFAFFECFDLKSVYISDLEAWCNIKKLEYSANPAYESASLYLNGELVNELTIPEGVTSIGDYAFSRYSNLTSVIIPDSVTSIGEGAFSSCSGLTNVTIPEGVTSIGEGAFSFCSGLTNVTIPEGVTSIGKSAFSGCSRLTSATIPKSVTSIGEYTFSRCIRLTSVTIPKSVTSIDDFAFYDCIGLTTVNYEGSETEWSAISIGPVNTYLTNATINYNYGKVSGVSLNTRSLKLQVGDEATLIATVEGGIGADTSVTWSTDKISVATVDENGKVIAVGTGSAVITVTTVEGGYSTRCAVTVVAQVVASGNCGENVTWTLDADGLLTISGSGAMTDYGSYSSMPWYAYRSDIKKIVIKEGVTVIERYAFYDYYDNLLSVTIPGSVASIGDAAFYGCDNLESVEIVDGVTSIGASAFMNCESLANITIPDSVTSIGGSAFCWCSSLTSITIPDGITSIENATFMNSGLISITIPDSVTSIGSLAFFQCEDLQSVTIPKGITSIEDNTFCNCESLTSITIPGSVTSIGEAAFWNCSALADVHYKGYKKDWANVTIDTYNAPLTNAAMHYRTEASVVMGGVETSYDTVGEAFAAADEAGKSVEVKLLEDVESVTVESEYKHTFNLSGKTVTTLNATGKALITNGAVTSLNVTGLVVTEDVTVTSTDAVNYATEGIKGIYTSYSTGVTMVDGAQVRIGDGVDESGKVVPANSGIRFITMVDKNDTLASVEGANFGVVISAEGTDATIDIPAEKWQGDDMYTSAVVNLAESNYNRKFTATPYIEIEGVRFMSESKCERSIYQVSAGLLKNESDEVNAGLANVLNAYVNQTGIRLLLKEGKLVAHTDSVKSGYYTGESFFTVGDTKYNLTDNTYTVTLTGVGKAEIKDYYADYVRINNNNSVIKTRVNVTNNDDGTYTLVFDADGLIEKPIPNEDDNIVPDMGEDGFDEETEKFN